MPLVSIRVLAVVRLDKFHARNIQLHERKALFASRLLQYGKRDQIVVEHPYWQYFCGGEFFEHEPQTDQTVMSRCRKRSGKTDATEMLMEILASAVKNKVTKPIDFERVNVDTTVQEKNIRFPTNARTLDRARERNVSAGARIGVHFKRNYIRKGKSMLHKLSGYVKTKQFNRANATS